MAQQTEQAQASTREFSIGRQNGQVAIDIKGTAHERVLFTPAEARRLVEEIERALGTGFGRDIEAIRKQSVQQ